MMKTTCGWWALVAACAVLALGGCCHNQKKDGEGVIVRGALPAYASVAEKYNARVVRLERLACPADLVVKYKDDKGKPLRDEVTANVQIALPASVVVRVDKVGQTVFYLGSNDTRYWWFDLTDEKTALVGLHEKATPEAVTSFGLPVHPLDLLEVFAIKPIPGAGTEQATHAVLAWSKDGHYLGLTLPGRWGGLRRFWLDPDSFDPVRVELLDKNGVVAVSAALSRYLMVDVDGDTTVHPRMASDFQVDLPRQQATFSLRLAAPQNPGEAQKAKLFDVDALLKYYRIQKVYDIDAPKAARQGSTGTQN
jgi:hypothetical protein